MTITALIFNKDTHPTMTTFSADLKVGVHTLTFISAWDNIDGEGWEFSCQVNIDQNNVRTFDRLTTSSEIGCVEFMIEHFEDEGVKFTDNLSRADIKVILASISGMAKRSCPINTMAKENYYGSSAGFAHQ
jgi:hypothetical protein